MYSCSLRTYCRISCVERLSDFSTNFCALMAFTHQLCLLESLVFYVPVQAITQQYCHGKMRNRRNSSVKLDLYARIVFKTILQHQDPNTGLVSDHPSGHAWIRDNVYSILSVWALSLAYKKFRDYDEDRAKAYESERACIKTMRGLLVAMTKQKEKIEAFKEDPSPINSIHAKFENKTGLAVVGDSEWGHLQVDINENFRQCNC